MKRTAKPRSPTPLELLPLAADEVWYGGVCSLSAVLRDEETGEPYHPQMALWVITGSHYTFDHRLAPAGGGPVALRELLWKMMRNPDGGRPRRPGTVRVNHPEGFRLLQDALTPLGIEVELVVSLEGHWNEAFDFLDDLISSPLGRYRPTTEAHASALSALFGAAAAFYRAEPWRLLSDQRPLSLVFPQVTSHTCGLLVTGAEQANRGLLIFASVHAMNRFQQVLSQISSGTAGPADLPPSTAIHFVTADRMPEEALSQARERGWEVAAPDAYPLVRRTVTGAGLVLDLSTGRLALAATGLQAATRFAIAAEADLRAGNPIIVREVEIDRWGNRFEATVSCPPVERGPVRRERKPALGPRGRE